MGVVPVGKDDLLERSDVVSLHLRLSDRTRGILGAEELARMKSSAILVNTSRGPLVDEGALVSALRDGTIAGAGLDVYDEEPLPADHPLAVPAEHRPDAAPRLRDRPELPALLRGRRRGHRGLAPRVAGARRSSPDRPGSGASARNVAAMSPETGSETGTETRTEHDSMGDIEVPRDALWRAQTQRAVENFPISGTTLEPSHVVAIARVKKAAARINAELGIITDERAEAIAAGADEIIGGQHHDAFPIDVFQTGFGHQLEHEHERGARLALGDRPASRCTPTTT